MTRKDYVRFAEMYAGEIALARHGITNHPDVWLKVHDLIRSTADIFAQDNPRFDRARFYLACGLEDK